ncbi:MAG TPA: L-seryl-tRNA(Sec) selenium transferase [Candidatus Dormibacteraeota bacterium]
MRAVPRPVPLPAVGRLLNLPDYQALTARYSRPLVTEALREQLDDERREGASAEAERVEAVSARLQAWTQPALKQVINATGVILHTNLGRAPLAAEAVKAAAAIAGSYSNLELDLRTGKRGERRAAVGGLLARLTGAEAALVVNNNAAAVLLTLTALAKGREVIVSRGQQVEIGGAFRMPDVMRLSGARMVEVGTTNRTRVADYEEAITERTAALLRVHTSNYRVSGFTESVALAELSDLARHRGLLLIDDLGSGALAPIGDEPLVADSVRHADAVCFSGDKLLGGPQAGIVLGRSEPLRRLAKHPLARAVRPDKMTLAALEATLCLRLLGREEELPVERMLRAGKDALRRRAAFWQVKLEERGVQSQLVEGASVAGGGSLPELPLPTVLLALDGPATKLLDALRRGSPAVLARIEGDRCCLDPRTVLKGEDETLIDAVEAAAAAR